MHRHRVIVPIVVAIFVGVPLILTESQFYPGNTALVVLLVVFISCLLMSKNFSVGKHKP